ncbi:MAG: metallophosphoesterase [Clostridia bacterium]|nr:metallophosphoesterase [Clostridia bacterium]
MKKLLKITAFILLCTIILGESLTLVQAEAVYQSDSMADYVPPSEPNSFVSNVYLSQINQEAPFFDVILPHIAANIEEYNKHSITPHFDKLPVLNNPENFQGLGHTTYANINGKTVTAESLFRVYNESSSDPNAGLGLLVYQCIQYKRAHPDEDVKITFSSYRTSCTAAVCVIPESKYYGYMRSLYGTDYDEHGFVRISFMLTEAARMGIEVTMVNQLNSYAVKQYDPSTGKTKSRSALNFKTYFNQALKSDCYNSYAPGKKVSDFMNCVNVGWNVTDKTADMQHVKSATASHYLATDGTEHTSAVFFGSANLDDNNYKGCNGNNGAQSGVIVSDHDDLYRVTYNYMQLMTEYPGVEDIYELRKVVNEMNEAQAALIESGRGDEIPADEQIIYLGTENDPVFEMYFTPFGGSVDAWDTKFNPICKYLEKFSLSDDYVELIWNEFGFGDCQIADTMSAKVEKAYCENPNINNKIAIRVDEFNTDAIQKLTLGSEIGYRSIKDGTNIHSKDIIMSYSEDGVRHNVCLLTSCNFYPIAFSYRTNSLLVIHETEDTDGNFYEVMGEKYSYGMKSNHLQVNPANLVLEVGDTYKPEVMYSENGSLKWSTSKKAVATVSADGVISAKKTGSATITVTDGTYTYKVNVTVVECSDCADSKGFTGSLDEKFVLTNKLGTTPQTFEAVISIKESQLKENATIFGSDGDFNSALVYYVNELGQPCVMIRDTDHHYKKNTYVFDKAYVATGEKVHLSIVTDINAKTISCYIDGKLVQTIKSVKSKLPFEEKFNPVIGGEHKYGNAAYFTGVISSVALWSDVRTADEIAASFTDGFDKADKNLLAAFDLSLCEDCRRFDLSANQNDLQRFVLWQDKEDVEPVGEYEYSFAVVGDTQTLAERDPLAMEALYDWILDNKDSQNIQYVIGVGDITENSTTDEWAYATEYINKLNGEIPYVLARGNHDTIEDFNKNLTNGFYETTVDGVMTEGDLTNSYRYFSIKGTDYLIMTLDFAPSSAALEWANKVISEHPDHKVIITTHAYLYRDGTTIDAGDCYPPSYYKEKYPDIYPDAQNGNDIWEKCISKHDNVLMVLSGHDPWQDIIYRQDETVNCNVVTQMLIDPQHMDEYIGSTAMVAMLYFSEDGKTLTVRYYSVAKDQYGSELSQFTLSLEPEHSPKYTVVKATLEENGQKTAICDKCNQITSVEPVYRPDTITISQTEFVYTGTELKPSVVVKDVKGTTLEKDKDYTVTYSGASKLPGKYTVKVEFIGDYSGEKTLDYAIYPGKTDGLTSKETAFDISLSWTQVAAIDGYEVYMYNAETKSFELLASVTENKYFASNLDSNTEYKFKVRAFATEDDGTKVYGVFSSEYSAKTLEYKKPINVYTDKTTDISVETYYDAQLSAQVIENQDVVDLVSSLFKGYDLEKLYSVELIDNGEVIDIDESIKVRIPAESDTHIYLLSESGVLVNMHAAYEDGYMIFITDELGIFAVAVKSEVPEETDPTEPSTPSDDTKPTTPSGPTGPSEGDDSKPSDSTEPSTDKPEDPSKPTDSSEPSKPFDPSNPSEPSDPVDDKGILGDVNGDGKVNIKDATQIQKFAAKLIELTDAEFMRADVNADTKVNIKDATAIQKYAAKLETGLPIGKKIV